MIRSGVEMANSVGVNFLHSTAMMIAPVSLSIEYRSPVSMHPFLMSLTRPNVLVKRAFTEKFVAGAKILGVIGSNTQ